MTKRLFIALEMPPSCCDRLVRLSTPMRGVRWLDAAHLHLTLAFPGHVTEAEEERVKEKLADVRVPPFFLPVQGVGVFGGARPSVLWAGVGAAHPHLFALHKRVHDALCAANLDLPLRPFHPHITLARVTEVSAQTLRPFLKKHEHEDFCLVEVTSFVLVSSRPGPEGSLYTVERRFELPSRDAL
jgi:2'-5' RNA ligase